MFHRASGRRCCRVIVTGDALQWTPDCSHTVNLWSQKRARAHLQGNMKYISQTSGDPLYWGEGLFNCCAMFQGNGGVSSASCTGNNPPAPLKKKILSIYLVFTSKIEGKNIKNTHKKIEHWSFCIFFIFFRRAIQAGTPDGTFLSWFELMSCIQLVKSPKSGGWLC